MSNVKSIKDHLLKELAAVQKKNVALEKEYAENLKVLAVVLRDRPHLVKERATFITEFPGLQRELDLLDRQAEGLKLVAAKGTLQ